ncbi:glycine betaine ABC transporter substrate-binding protein [Halalkalibacillus halophilus]|uniref:ABC transporter substrate-binding protein n=1 Tax=Halalkalibacillus halophilus TaxID=392827 RepID=UPI000415F05A|nr:glycine betaine ABC transporter substrate-binding protein [Halalkalibacillus halophilus]
MKKLLLIGIIALMTVVVAACGSDEEGGSDRSLIVSGKNWTEQYILTYIIGEYIQENSDYDVQYEEGLGEVAILTPALEDGEIDLYVEYTGTGLEAVLGEVVEEGESADSVYERVKEGYEEEYNVTWLEPLGFENTYTLAFAEDAEFEASTASELVELSQERDMIFGAPHAFYEREGDGYDAMVETYPFEFTETPGLDANLMYDAVRTGEVDLIPAFTTDGRIERFNLQTTEDDQGFFPQYDAVPIVRMDTLEDFPELEDLLNELAGTMDEEVMQDLNARVDIDEERYEDVARDFLIEHDLIEE